MSFSVGKNVSSRSGDSTIGKKKTTGSIRKVTEIKKSDMGAAASAEQNQENMSHPKTHEPGHRPMGIFARLVDKPDLQDRKRVELFRLVQSGQATVEQLRDADPNQPGPYNRRLLHLAAESGRADLVAHLVSRMGANIEAQDADLWSPAHFAASANAGQALRELMKLRPSLGKLPNSEGQTPLMTAAIYGAPRAAKVLLEFRDCVDVNAVDNDGDTATILAARCGHAPVLRVLLGHNKTSLKCKNFQGKRAVDYARERGDARMVEVLKV